MKVVILVMCIAISFGMGFLLQMAIKSFFSNIRFDKLKVSSVISGIVGVWYWQCKIKLSRNKKMKIYKKAMKMPLESYELGEKPRNETFLIALSSEDSLHRIEKLLLAILQAQENLRRKRVGEGGRTLVRQMFIGSGKAAGLSIPEYYLSYIFFQKHLAGDSIPLRELEKATRIFGSKEENFALKFSNDIHLENSFMKLKWVEYKTTEKRLERFNKKEKVFKKAVD